MNDIRELLVLSEIALNNARDNHDNVRYEDAEKEALNVIQMLEPYTHRNDLGHEKDNNSVLYKVFGAIAHAYNRLNSLELSRHNFHQSLVYAQAGIEISERIGNTLRLVHLYINMGDAYLHKSEYNLALDNYRIALEKNEIIHNKELLAKITGQMGIAYKELTDYTTALEYFHRALILHEELDNKSGVAGNTMNIGVVHQVFGEHERALECFLRALSIFEMIQDKVSIAFALSSIGGVYFRLKEFEHALELYQRALALQLELGEKRDALVARGNIGHVYKNIGEYDKAYEYLIQAYHDSVEISAIYPQLHWLNGLGDLLSDKAYHGYSPKKAEEYLLQAVEISILHGIKNITLTAYESLETLYSQIEDWQKAYEARKFFDTIKEQINIEGAQRKAEQRENERKIAEQEKRLAIERAASQARIEEQEKLLHNVLPPTIAERLLKKETFIADSYPSVSVLFMDLVNFTRIASIVPPKHLIYVLNTIFSTADNIMEQYGLEKIKTIGDAYMAVSGAPIVQDDHALRAAAASIALLDRMNTLHISIPSDLGDISWIEAIGEIGVRIGIHSGEAIGGVIGDKKFSFDLWGDAVNTASRMESHGEVGKIHCSADFMRAVATGHDLSLRFIPRGEMEIKGKGKMKTYFLEKVSAP
ncbi:MAG: tetratricopeptide repeat protein [Candidatus Kapabacteria bacterium]|nr:tetratricopeptide repeat protein [Candidatus Kapabacteria bacterium]